ncbi:unnamed protein product [Vitrella brassicaformis CCMP3155]|uniref:Uncharacterized protein n=1 Tax=Vitrella brassicaformis (strain CCMP3155) TaxID=1169540 RepID=A0A0G4F979_VITBC|nr:unnamed protein product [Vitrella brassicaformis CCMP3155]|eukprot:CEM09182.1 unnamed protein product [Vitrella brassicaformis CCMP3155]
MRACELLSRSVSLGKNCIFVGGALRTRSRLLHLYVIYPPAACFPPERRGSQDVTGLVQHQFGGWIWPKRAIPDVSMRVASKSPARQP